MPARLNLLVIRAADVDAAAHFYELLGLRFVQHAHGSGPIHYAAETDGFVFEIYPLGAGDASTSATRLGFQVECVDQVLADLVAAGGKPVSSPRNGPWGYRAVIDDLDGHRIELTSPATAP